QTPGTGWTIAGIVASQCGTPLLVNEAHHGNDIMLNGFLDDAVCLGDVLHKAGYYQSYLGGASLNFAGKGNFLKQHAYDDVRGFDELYSQLPNKHYRTRWGLYDDTLFSLAEKKFAELADAKKPFNLTVLTMDTHHPNGHASQTCEDYPELDNRMLDAVHCSDQLVEKFIRSISSHPEYKNTIVIVMSDHRAMRNDASKLYPTDYNRKLFFFALNSGAKGISSIPGSHMDIAPTILDLLGVNNDVAFLGGESLVSKNARQMNPKYSNRSTRDRIRWVNSSFFSRSDADICSEKQMVQFEKPSSVKIGGKRLALSYLGWTNRFPKAFHSGRIAIVSFLKADGSILESTIIETKDLDALQLEHQDEPFLVIAKFKALPKFLRTADTSNSHLIHVVLGRTQGPVVTLGTFKKIQDLSISSSDCKKILASIAAIDNS
ncbi:MAG: sulfatase-like hydrolase/transferase, partial [bacterium]|nr:sulfatase-like hydrolase/transferase [bacterium]